MKTSDRRRTVGALALATVTACIVLLPACDPSTLSPEQRRLLTGTSDAGDITLTVTPTEATVVDTLEFSYHVSSVGFAGTLSLSLSGLAPDVGLVKDLNHSTPVPVEGNRDLDGTFVVRALRERADPIDIFLNLTSVGSAGSRVEHPPARIRLFLRPSAPLDLDCSRDPESGHAPLTVRFEARVTGCSESCAVLWDFGDDTGAEERRVEHTYTRAGEYLAVALVTDASGRTARCERGVRVRPRDSDPTPTPTPTAPTTAPPSASFTFRTTCCPATLNLDASGSTGTIVSYTWDLSWTPATPDAVTTSPTTTFPINEGDRGSITLTVTAADGQMASTTRAYP